MMKKPKKKQLPEVKQPWGGMYKSARNMPREKPKIEAFASMVGKVVFVAAKQG